jgi:hypothetical protein
MIAKDSQAKNDISFFNAAFCLLSENDWYAMAKG